MIQKSNYILRPFSIPSIFPARLFCVKSDWFFKKYLRGFEKKFNIVELFFEQARRNFPPAQENTQNGKRPLYPTKNNE